MRRISLSIAILVWGLMSVSNASFAADQYAYRAGQVYMKTAAGNFRECEAQCRSDAACRSWNFIRPNPNFRPNSRSGICEFNARQAPPISSPISISGDINTNIGFAVNPPIIPMRAVNQTVKRPNNVPQMMGMRTYAPQRIIKRLPADNVVRAPIPAGYQPISQTRLQPFTGPVQPRSMTRQQIYREQVLAAQKRAAKQTQIRTRQQAQYRAIAAPIPPQQYIPKARQTPRQALIQAPIQAPRQAPIMPVPAPPNQQSLYGSLYDDLTRNMTPVPRPQTAPDQVRNPDAPLATNRVVPVAPIQDIPFNYPVIPGLAGG